MLESVSHDLASIGLQCWRLRLSKISLPLQRITWRHVNWSQGNRLKDLKSPFPSISPSPETLFHSVKCARKTDTKTIKGKRLTSQKYLLARVRKPQKQYKLEYELQLFNKYFTKKEDRGGCLRFYWLFRKPEVTQTSGMVKLKRIRIIMLMMIMILVRMMMLAPLFNHLPSDKWGRWSDQGGASFQQRASDRCLVDAKHDINIVHNHLDVGA